MADPYADAMLRQKTRDLTARRRACEEDGHINTFQEEGWCLRCNADLPRAEGNAGTRPARRRLDAHGNFVAA